MPFTPLHLAAAAPAKALLKGRFSVGIFFATQVVIDIEPLIGMLAGVDPIHGFFHTFGGSLVAAALALTVWWAWRGARLGSYTVRPIGLPWAVLTAWWGAWSHIMLDSVMHAEMRMQALVLGVYAPSVDRAHGATIGLIVMGAVIATVTYSPEIFRACRRVLARPPKRRPESARGRHQ